MKSQDPSNDPVRVIIYAESGLLAGDLAALLSAKFQVKRATTLGAAAQALRDRAHALILVDGRELTRSEALKSLAGTAVVAGVMVLVLGGDPSLLSSELAGQLTFLPTLPGPGVIMAALDKETPLVNRAES